MNPPTTNRYPWFQGNYFCLHSPFRYWARNEILFRTPPRPNVMPRPLLRLNRIPEFPVRMVIRMCRVTWIPPTAIHCPILPRFASRPPQNK